MARYTIKDIISKLKTLREMISEKDIEALRYNELIMDIFDKSYSIQRLNEDISCISDNTKRKNSALFEWYNSTQKEYMNKQKILEIENFLKSDYEWFDEIVYDLNEMDYDEDYDEDYNEECDDEQEHNNTNPGFLALYADGGVDREKLIQDIENTIGNVIKRNDEIIEQECESIDTEYVNYHIFETIDVVEEKDKYSIYFEMNAGVEVEWGSGEICQIYLELGEELSKALYALFEKEEYKRIKYEGVIKVTVQDNYWNSVVLTSVSNMHEIKRNVTA